MKPNRFPFGFSRRPWIWAGLALVAGSFASASCGYTLPNEGAGGAGSCGEGLTRCGNACVDTLKDSTNCGACNELCNVGYDCNGGQCELAAVPCIAGSVEACYEAPVSTMNMGTCHPGVHVCNANGMGYGPCEGQSIPVKDECNNGLDEDCNGVVDQGAKCMAPAGLVVQYVLDEAADGKGPTMVKDSAPNPLDLTIDYGGNDNMRYTSLLTGRGLHWDKSGGSGTASALIDATKVWNALQGKTQGTIEIVARFEAVEPTASRIFTIGLGTESGRFSLTSSAIDHVSFWWLDGAMVGDWQVNLASAGRCLLHLVVDTSSTDPLNRVRLYLNGSTAGPNVASPPGLNLTIDLGPGRSLYLGNREGGVRSFAGTLYYAALYDRALADVEIMSRASRLLSLDD